MQLCSKEEVVTALADVCCPQQPSTSMCAPNTTLCFKHVHKTQVKETPEAPALAQQNLKAMGPMSKGELITLATISGAVVLWMFGDAIGCPAVLAAMLALATLLCTGEAKGLTCLFGI
jgi:di/tricarboxylate transporter